MINERIDQILDENNLVFESIIAKERIYRSMQQYALETPKDGFCAGSDAVHKLLRPEIERLQALVQAQNELIDLYDKHTVLGMGNYQYEHLRKQIKELEA